VSPLPCLPLPQEWLTRTVEAVDSLLFDVCRSFHPVSYARVWGSQQGLSTCQRPCAKGPLPAAHPIAAPTLLLPCALAHLFTLVLLPPFPAPLVLLLPSAGAPWLRGFCLSCLAPLPGWLAAVAQVVDAYAVMDDAPSLAEKAQNFFAQSVVTETYDTLLHFMDQVGKGFPGDPWEPLGAPTQLGTGSQCVLAPRRGTRSVTLLWVIRVPDSCGAFVEPLFIVKETVLICVLCPLCVLASWFVGILDRACGDGLRPWERMMAAAPGELFVEGHAEWNTGPSQTTAF